MCRLLPALFFVLLLSSTNSNAQIARWAPPVWSAASSCALGCDNPALTHWNLLNKRGNFSPTTAWSSQYHPGPDAYEWAAVWFNSVRLDRVILHNRVYNDKSVCAPEFVHVYFSDGVNWVYDQTVYLREQPSDHPHFQWTQINPRYKGLVNGVLLTTTRLRPDPFGGYYFQIGVIEAYGFAP